MNRKVFCSFLLLSASSTLCLVSHSLPICPGNAIEAYRGYTNGTLDSLCPGARKFFEDTMAYSRTNNGGLMDHMNQDSGVLNGAVSFLWGNFRRNFGLNRCIPNSISAMFAWNRGPSADCVLEGVRAGIEGIGTLIAVAGGAKLAVIEESVQRIEQVFANAAGNPLGKDESNLIKEELTALVNNLTEEELHKRFETIARNIAPDDQERQTMIVDLLNVFASEVRQKAAPKAQPSGVDVGLTEMIIRLSNLAGQNRDKIESLLASTGEGEWATQIKGQLFKAFSPLLPDVNNTTDATIRTEL